MSKITEIPTACPQCGGGIYDNTKGEGKRNPKSPDARCKDRDGCGWSGWLPKQEKAAGVANRAAQTEAWGPLLKRCVQYVKKHVAPEFEHPNDAIIQELATALFTAGTIERGHMWTLPNETQDDAAAAPQPVQARPSSPARRPPLRDGGLPF